MRGAHAGDTPHTHVRVWVTRVSLIKPGLKKGDNHCEENSQMDFQINERILRRLQWKRRLCLFKEENQTHDATYKRFRRRIIQRSGQSPAASTPLSTRGRCAPSCEFASVCQRLEFSPVKKSREVSVEGSCSRGVLSLKPPKQSIRAGGCPGNDKIPIQRADWVWRAAVQADGSSQQTDSDERNTNLQPFVILKEANISLQNESLMTLGAPSLLNDYYSSLLDCSSRGMVALALGSRVYIWNSETRSLVGRLDPDPGGPQHRTLSISCLSWSRDGRVLCIGDRRGQMQLWDVDYSQNTRQFQSHLSVVTAVSWKQQLLSSGSALGHIHHLDPRAPPAVVGSASQNGSVCGLQWSPGNQWLASGSTEGLLHVWDKDVAGVKRSRQPVRTMKQPSAVKALGWCPWQSRVIATGGGWKDGTVRIWDTQSESCLMCINTNSQWAERKKSLVTGHGLPHHQITLWNWESPALSQSCQLTGHSQRVLHLAINPDNTHIFTAGADQRFCVWGL